MPLTFSDADKKRHAEALQAWFLDERGEDIGSLQASFLLDFILDELGPAIYAAALTDVQAHLTTVVQDLDLTLAASGTRSPRR